MQEKTKQSSGVMSELFQRPGFLVVLLILVAGAIGINAATSSMKLHFRKEALPLRAPEGLSALPQQIGNWVCVPEPHMIDPDMVHELGTEKYVFRDYVNTAIPGIGTKKDILAIGDLNPKQRIEAVNDLRKKNVNAVLSFAVTYYTGKVDTVPHVPDRCYVADGFQPGKYDQVDWHLGDYSSIEPRVVPVRFIDFDDVTSRGAQSRCVSYFFHANGKYEQDPLAVRRSLQDLFQKYGYFAKIEVMTALPTRPGSNETDPLRDKDRKLAAAAMKEFLTGALPEVEKILPDWKSLPR